MGEKDCESLNLQIKSTLLLENKSENLPTGKIINIEGTDFDFRKPLNIGIKQRNTHDYLKKIKKGYDHCFVLDKTICEEPVAILTSLKNKISLSVYTDQPALQLYTGFYLSGKFSSYQGLCLEAQNYVDAENNEHFPSNIVKPNQQYQRIITYKFETVS